MYYRKKKLRLSTLRLKLVYLPDDEAKALRIALSLSVTISPTFIFRYSVAGKPFCPHQVLAFSLARLARYCHRIP